MGGGSGENNFPAFQAEWHILVDGPPTRERLSGSKLALLMYAYPGEYGLK